MDGGRGGQLAKTFIAAVASRDSAAWAAMFTDDAKYAIPETPEPVRGREALDAMASMFFEAFPDMAFEVRTVIEQGSIVVLEAATKGTFTGPMATPEGEVPPTGRSYIAPLVAICELTDTGLIAECREYYDPAGLAAQIGLSG